MTDLAPPPAATTDVVAQLDELPVGSVRMVRVDGERLCLVRTESGVYAMDHACPHEGYGMTQGDLDGDVITCAWHNWKFRVTDGRCLLGEEDIATHPVDVGEGGEVAVTVRRPDPAEQRPKLFASLRRGIERDYVGQISRDVIRLLRGGADPVEMAREAVAHGAPRAEYGWGHAMASLTDALDAVDLWDGDERALPLVQGIAGISETSRDRVVWELPEPAGAVPADGASAFRALVESEDLTGAQALLRAAIARGDGPDELRHWFTLAVSDHHLGYGHGAIYAQKAFQLLDRLGWDRADVVLGPLVMSTVYGTREDKLPYMRPFMRELAGLDLGELSEIEPAADWADGGRLRDVLLGNDRRLAVATAADALRDGAGVHGLLDTVVEVVSTRMLRYDHRGEFDFSDDFGWLDITHGLTYANAARWHHRHTPGPDTLRLALFCAFLAQWTGRHEWHTEVLPEEEPEPSDDLTAACLAGMPAHAVGAALSADAATAAVDLQRVAQLDRTTAFIVHAHAVKMGRAAGEEAAATGSNRPMAATARFLAAPKLERFVAANVQRSLDFLSGKAPRDVD